MEDKARDWWLIQNAFDHGLDMIPLTELLDISIEQCMFYFFNDYKERGCTQETINKFTNYYIDCLR